jgi:hypothetical protein
MTAPTRDFGVSAVTRRVVSPPRSAKAHEGTQMSEDLLCETLVELVDTVVADFDVVDFLHVLVTRSAELLEAAAGAVLADRRGALRLAAASTEGARLLQSVQLDTAQGPCLDCFRACRPIAVPDIAAAERIWPRFARAAQQLELHSGQSFPMRLRDQVIGVLNLFRPGRGCLSLAELRVGQRLADAATIGLMHQRSVSSSEMLIEQLQTALNSRVLIEQAKGKLA